MRAAVLHAIEDEKIDIRDDVTVVGPGPGQVRIRVLAHGSRASLVDAVLDLPEVQKRPHLKAAVPLGDSESLERLRERTEDLTARAAGSTALVEAKIPPSGQRESSADPDGESAT